MGLAAETFSGGQVCLRQSQIDRTACLIADVNMPEMNGLDPHCSLSVLDNAFPTRLITPQRDDRLRAAVETDIISYLVKPFAEVDLLGGLGRALAL
jgi:FixJ family two-component response regulator